MLFLRVGLKNLTSGRLQTLSPCCKKGSEWQPGSAPSWAFRAGSLFGDRRSSLSHRILLCRTSHQPGGQAGLLLDGTTERMSPAGAKGSGRGRAQLICQSQGPGSGRQQVRQREGTSQRRNAFSLLPRNWHYRKQLPRSLDHLMD